MGVVPRQIVRPEMCPCQTGRLQFLLRLTVPSPQDQRRIRCRPSHRKIHDSLDSCFPRRTDQIALPRYLLLAHRRQQEGRFNTVQRSRQRFGFPEISRHRLSPLHVRRAFANQRPHLCSRPRQFPQ